MRAVFFLGFVSVVSTLVAQHSFTPADVENGGRLYRGNCLNCHGPDGDFIPKQQADLVVAYLRSLAMSAGHYSPAAGDKTRGKAIVESKGQCLTCHRISGNGSRVGPDLSDIGGFRRAGELAQSLVEPDAEIAPENRFFRVVMRNGTTFTAKLLNQDTFTMQFMNPNEQLVSLQKSDIREYTFLSKSSMPSYKDKLSSQELADVVSYLISLKGEDKP